VSVSSAKGRGPRHAAPALSGAGPRPLDVDEHGPVENPVRKLDYLAILNQLALDEDKVGEWFAVVEYPTSEQARSAATSLRAGRYRVPVGKWEFSTRTVDGGAVLFARFLGRDGVEKVADDRPAKGRAKRAGGKAK
jgi:hypothetical protein